MTDSPQSTFERMRLASRADDAPDAEMRRDRLQRLIVLVQRHADAFARAISEDFGGRSPHETQLLEVIPTLRAARHARRHVARWMRDERRPVDWIFQPARAWVRYEPVGVVGIISPWNYPLFLALGPLVDALAAGNRAMLKPSELTPRFADCLATALADGFADDEVAVVIGGVETAKSFAAMPFDHLIFTGSTAVGRDVMRAAANNLTPVTLELGGKSPAIVAPDYELAKAASSIAFGKFVNAGQTCIAPDYVLVPWESREQFANMVLAAARKAYPVPGSDPDYTAIISERHRSRLLAALAEVRDKGAVVLPDQQNAGTKIEPTVVLEPPAHSLLMREEIFGPILPVIGYRDLDEAVSIIADRERPLALYCYSNDREFRQGILRQVTSGGVTINGTLLHIAQDALPFGGIGPSGMGAYHGREGFLRLSHARGIYQVGPVNFFERLGPPWGRLARVAAKFLAR